MRSAPLAVHQQADQQMAGAAASVGHRTGEVIGAAISNLFSFLFVSGLKKYKPIQGSLVAKSMLDHAKSKIKGFQIIESDEMNT